MLKSIPLFQTRAFQIHSRRHVCVMSVNSPSNTANHKRKMIQIGTHNGTFHCDEALGCYLLQKTGRFSQGQVVRSRDQEVLKDLDIVIDVGGVYNPGRHFDNFTATSALQVLSQSATGSRMDCLCLPCAPRFRKV